MVRYEFALRSTAKEGERALEEACLYRFGTLRPCVRDVFVVTVWYGLNDLLDYGIGPHPRVPNPWDFTAITIFAVGTTVVLSVVWLILALVRSRRARTISASSGI